MNTPEQCFPKKMSRQDIRIFSVLLGRDKDTYSRIGSKTNTVEGKRHIKSRCKQLVNDYNLLIVIKNGKKIEFEINYNSFISFLFSQFDKKKLSDWEKLVPRKDQIINNLKSKEFKNYFANMPLPELEKKDRLIEHLYFYLYSQFSEEPVKNYSSFVTNIGPRFKQLIKNLRNRFLK